MLFYSRLLAFSLIVLGSCMDFKSAQAEDKIVGVIWELGRKGKGGKVVWGARFRATPDGKIWNLPKTSVPKVIGDWSGDEEKTIMKIDKITHPLNIRGNGTYELVLVGKDPKVWQGTFVSRDAQIKIPIFARLVKD